MFRLLALHFRSGKELMLETSALESLCMANLPLVINSVDKPNFHLFNGNCSMI